MAINFPNNPAVNDTFTVSGTTFTFTGVKWETSAVVELSSDTTPSLGGALDAGTHNINNVGVITATTFSGNLIGNVTGTATTATYAQTAGISTYATTAGVSTYASTAGVSTVSTNAQGLTGTPNITVGTITGTDATFSGDLTVQGTTTTIDTAVTAVDSLAIDGLLTTLGSVGVGTTNPNSMGRVSIVVPSTGGHGAINIQNPEVGTGKTNIVFRSIDNNGGNWADAELRAEGYSFKIRTTERFRIDFDGTVSDSMGPLRRLGINYHNAATYTLVAGDAGKLVREATNGANITIPQNVFSAGDMISIFNVSGGDNTITQGTGTTLYNTADGATGNRTLAAKGVCTIACTSTNEFIISGSGLS